MYEDRVLAHAREPALEHDLHQPVVLLVRRRGRARERERGHDRLRVVLDHGLVELLELEVRARDVAVCRPREVREVRLPRGERPGRVRLRDTWIFGRRSEETRR